MALLSLELLLVGLGWVRSILVMSLVCVGIVPGDRVVGLVRDRQRVSGVVIGFVNCLEFGIACL